MTTLRQKSRSGLFWTVIEAFFKRSFTLATNLILTRLLSPDEFGLLGLIMVFIAIGNALVEGGLGNSIIRDTESDDTDFSTIFFANVGMSFLLYAIMFFSAPWISGYFERPILIDVIRVYGLTLIITAFSSIQKSLLTKTLDFKKITLWSMPGIVIGAIIGISMAFLGYGVWSLVAMQLATQLVVSIFIWVKSDWKPKYVFSMTKMKRHWNFGYKLMLSSVMNSMFTELYSLIIAKNFSIASLGYYNRAKAYSRYPVNMISQVISKVSYPMLVQMKDDREKISQVYQTLIRSVFYLVTPVMFALAVVAEPLFLLLFTEKWLPAVPYFQILTFSGILQPIHSFNLNVFKVFDRTDLHLKLALMKKVLMGGVVVTGLMFGITEMLWAIVASSYLGLILNTYYSEQLIGYKTIKQIKDLAPTFLTALLAAAFGYYVLSTMEGSALLLQILLIPLMVIAIFLSLNIALKNKSHKELIKLLKMILKGKVGL